MPSFSIDVDFEVFCATCGVGLCNVSDTRYSRQRHCNQVTVECCPDCIEKKQKEINELKSDISILEKQLEKLQDGLDEIREKTASM